MATLFDKKAIKSDIVALMSKVFARGNRMEVYEQAYNLGIVQGLQNLKDTSIYEK